MELQQLREQLQKNIKGEIVRTDYWNIPVYTLKVAYKPIVKTTMDILMKMILLSIQEASFKHAQEISDILLVEQLFIEDLMKKMQKTELIEKKDNYYELTLKGRAQLQNGIYEEEQPVKTVELLYSPVHQSFVQGDIEAIFEFEEYPEQLYRHYNNEEQLTIDDAVILTELQKVKSIDEGSESDPNNNPVIIQSIDSYDIYQINDVPCIEFLVKESDNSNLSAKVWNTLVTNWDETLQQQLTDKGVSH